MKRYVAALLSHTYVGQLCTLGSATPQAVGAIGTLVKTSGISIEKRQLREEEAPALSAAGPSRLSDPLPASSSYPARPACAQVRAQPIVRTAPAVSSCHTHHRPLHSGNSTPRPANRRRRFSRQSTTQRPTSTPTRRPPTSTSRQNGQTQLRYDIPYY